MKTGTVKLSGFLCPICKENQLPDMYIEMNALFGIPQISVILNAKEMHNVSIGKQTMCKRCQETKAMINQVFEE